MLVEKIKEACTDLVLEFNYGGDHWQNTQDLPNDDDMPFANRKKYFFLIWQDRDFIKNNHGATVGYTYTGEALLVVRSKISDSDYNFKYDTHIKNLQAESDKMEDSFGNCDEWLVKRWKEIEVENVYDTNLDGLKIQFTIQVDIE